MLYKEYGEELFEFIGVYNCDEEELDLLLE